MPSHYSALPPTQLIISTPPTVNGSNAAGSGTPHTPAVSKLASKPLCENVQIKTLQDIQGRAKTVRIGKVRWPPPLKESETFESELQRRLELQKRIQEEISALNAALAESETNERDTFAQSNEKTENPNDCFRETLRITLNVTSFIHS